MLNPKNMGRTCHADILCYVFRDIPTDGGTDLGNKFGHDGHHDHE